QSPITSISKRSQISTTAGLSAAASIARIFSARVWARVWEREGSAGFTWHHERVKETPSTSSRTFSARGLRPPVWRTASIVAQGAAAEARDAVDCDNRRGGQDQHAEAEHGDGPEIPTLFQIEDQHRHDLGL